MESHSLWIFLQHSREFEILAHIAPNFDRFVFGASYNKLLPDTNIKSGDVFRVKVAMDMFKFVLTLSAIVQRYINLHELSALSNEVNEIISMRKAH